MLHIDSLSNGLNLIVEEMPHLESVALSLMLPGGLVRDRQGRIGASLMLAELISRGAGPHDSRALSDAFDRLGIRHAEHADSDRYSFSASMLADRLPEAIELISLMLFEPHLPEADMDAVRSLCLQDLKSLMDNPARRVMDELSQRFFPSPWNRPSHGTEEDIKSVTQSDVHSLWADNFKPQGAILSIAGRVTSAEIARLADDAFAKWAGQGTARPAFGQVSKGGTHFIREDSSQTQIALAYPSEKFLGKHYYAAKVAASLLSGGMFGRLFTEVREKRGLVYSVYARHSCNADHGEMMLYAGTTPERAAETLEVSLNEIRNLGQSIEADELARSKTNLLASLIIGQETSMARTSSNAMEYWLARKVRELEEIQAGINAVTTTDIQNFLAAFPPTGLTLLTLGRNALEVK